MINKKIYQDNGYLGGKWEDFKGNIFFLKVSGGTMDICCIISLYILHIFYKCSFIAIQCLLEKFFNFKNHLNFKKTLCAVRICPMTPKTRTSLKWSY